MSDSDSERLRCEQKLKNLLYQNDLLKREQKEIFQYGQYFERMQWTNYGQEPRKELEKRQQIWQAKKQKLDLELETLQCQIQKAQKLPKGTKHFLDAEELEAYLVDLRFAWYQNKPLNWFTHTRVWMKTWIYVLIEIGLEQPIVLIIHKYQPLHKPRLPK